MKRVSTLLNAGRAAYAGKDWTRAEAAFRKALRIDARCEDAWLELGCLLLDSQRNPEAQACFERVRPGHYEDAVAALEGILAQREAWARGHFSLGCAYEVLGRSEAARREIMRSVQLDPTLQAAGEGMLALISWKSGRAQEALAASDRALELNPSNFLALSVRGQWYRSQCMVPEEAECIRRAIRATPHADLHCRLLFILNLLTATTPEDVYEEARRWHALHAAPLEKQIRPHTNSADPERRLKVGYVSCNVYSHAIMRFLPPILDHHDPAQFEARLYAIGDYADDVTRALKRTYEHLVEFHGTASELAELIRADGIDILVDLTGHTMNWDMFQVFALKPAPVQVSWIGVLATTGLRSIDYFLGDLLLPCPGTEHLFTEQVYRIPRQGNCYRPLADVPVAPAPCLERGYVTFGAFHSPLKITREVVKLWSAILHLVPGSRMLLKFGGMETAGIQGRLAGWFAEDGIPAGRLTFAAHSPPLEYLAAFGQVDIGLDPFPYNGGSTTLDSLWMGVPVVTLAGRLAVQRTGAVVLTSVGLGDLVAATPGQYLRTAVYLASIVAQEPELRAEVRQALVHSPYMDEVGAVRAAEDAFRDMWRTWCKTRSGSRQETEHASSRVPA